MTLIKCSECNKEISDKSISCLFCGNPNDKPVTIEITNKKWKKTNLVGILFLILATMAWSSGELELFWLLISISLLIGIISRIGAWWTNG